MSRSRWLRCADIAAAYRTGGSGVTVVGTETARAGASVPLPRVVDVRAYVRADALWPRRPDPATLGLPTTPWQLQPVASPLSSYPGHEIRTVGGPSWVGHFVVEVESADGHVGRGVSV